MFAVLAGFVVGLTMSGEQRQHMSFDAAALGVVVGVASSMMRRIQRLGDIEGDVDRHQRIERKREKAEPGGPDGSSQLPRAQFG